MALLAAALCVCLGRKRWLVADRRHYTNAQCHGAVVRSSWLGRMLAQHSRAVTRSQV